MYNIRYEELSRKYNGLLKILEMRLSEIRNRHEENEKLKEDIQSMEVKLKKYKDEISILLKRFKDMKTKKKMKVGY